MTLVAEIRRIDSHSGKKLRVDLFTNGTEVAAASGDLVHTAGRVGDLDATDTAEAHVRSALRVLGIGERPVR